MLVQIQAIQVPDFWEVIKFAAVNSDHIEEQHIEYYCLELLQDLLSNKKICFIAQKEEFVVILEFKVDKMRNMKYLYFNNLYSFKHQTDAIWEEVFSDFYKIAKAADCKAIMGDSNNDKVAEINKNLGTLCLSKKYAYYL